MKKLLFMLTLLSLVNICYAQDLIDVRIRSYLPCGDNVQYISIEQFNKGDYQKQIDQENEQKCIDFENAKTAQQEAYIEPSANDYISLYTQKTEEAKQYLDLAVSKADSVQLEDLKTRVDSVSQLSVVDSKITELKSK